MSYDRFLRIAACLSMGVVRPGWLQPARELLEGGEGGEAGEAGVGVCGEGIALSGDACAVALLPVF